MRLFHYFQFETKFSSFFVLNYLIYSTILEPANHQGRLYQSAYRFLKIYLRLFNTLLD